MVDAPVSTPVAADPLALEASYAARERALTEAYDQERRRERSVVYLAFGSVALALLAVGAGLDGVVSWWIVGPFCVAPVVLVQVRELRTRRRLRVGYRRDFVQRQRSRLSDRWTFGQPNGREFADADHAYASDLDLFGPSSLFERMNATQTVLGRDALARLLRGDDVAGTVDERRQAVSELMADREFREAFDEELRALVEGLPGDARARQTAEERTRELLEFGCTPSPPRASRFAVALRIALALTATGVLVAKVVFGWSWLIVGVAYGACAWLHGRGVDADALARTFEQVDRSLGAWSRVLERIGRGGFRSPLLKSLAGLAGREAPAAIAELHTLASRLSWRRNVIYRLTVDTFWLLDFHWVQRLLAWKERHGTHLRSWLISAARLEAWCALATWAEAQSGSTFAEVAAEGPVFEAEGLAHPLLSRSARVPNDVAITNEGSVFLVTGSNMSGKSTFLRSVGLASVLASLGLPIPAKRLRLRPMTVATCMRVGDDLAQGLSLFNAEVRRLKACVDRAEGGERSLVLLDEILSGTNSRERHLGAAAVIRSLVRGPTVVFVSTHDLGLTSIADEMGQKATLVHFHDGEKDGRMTFDYLMRPGPVPSTNALRVMRAAGLDVPESAA